MPSIDFTSAYYIKLGRGGVWEAESIETGKLRLGWKGTSVHDINSRKWNLIRRQIQVGQKGKRLEAGSAESFALTSCSPTPRPVPAVARSMTILPMDSQTFARPSIRNG